jgi:hypothetical protein
VPARPARRACQHAVGDCFVGGCKGDMVQLWRICTVFFPLRSLAGDGSPGGCKGDMVQLWRVCTVFF